MITNNSHTPDEQNLAIGITKLTDYFKAGAVPAGQGRLGFELEQIIVDEESGFSVPFAGERGITGILQQLSPLYEREIRASPNDPSSPLIGLARGDATITLEPGAQFEFSSKPFWNLEDLLEVWDKYQNELFEITDTLGYVPLDIGYQPRTLVEDITLLPKERYNMMNQHFKGTGSHGMNMMRGSAATQVAIDYRDEADAITKLRVAAALTPLLSLLSDNTPFFEGKPVSDYMKRTTIWNDVDPDRSMIPPKLFTPNYGFATYAESVLTAPVILFDKDGVVQYAGNKGAADCYDMNEVSQADFEHILSMFFFDVRLRNYVEIRCADSMPFPFALAYVALIKGLFYDEKNLIELSERFAHFDDNSVPAIKAELISKGYGADVGNFYRKGALSGKKPESVQSALRGLVKRAKRGLVDMDAEGEAGLLDVFLPLIEGETTLAREFSE